MAPVEHGRGRKKGTGGIAIALEEPTNNGQHVTTPLHLETTDLARIVVQNPGFYSDNASTTSKGKRKRWTIRGFLSWIGQKSLSAGRTFMGTDWVFLAALGMGMAMLSFAMDDCIDQLGKARKWIFAQAGTNIGLQYLAWTGPKLALVLFSTLLCAYVAPQATGSGLPEMKTILRGVVLHEYLTFRALVTKAVALTLCLGSGIPIGKEGPFVHICSIMATLLIKLLASFRKTYHNANVKTDMLAAACAVGVACTFGSPIGGVLFSIEVTSVYFAVRNYWRGFFAATCSAIIFRMTTVWFKFEASPVAFAQTAFSTLMPFQPGELIIYALIGRLIYPTIIVLIISSITFPPGPGQFMVSMISSKAAIADMFSNVSWLTNNTGNLTSAVLDRWSPQGVPVFATLAVYALCNFITAVMANTLPIPTGVFIPTFVIGAAVGRIVGELGTWLAPSGIFNEYGQSHMVAGSYALVGAAAYTGAVTHTFSTSVIVFELTGQIVYILPVMVGVLIANAIAAYIQPSIFDSIIKMKKLPYLPAMLPIDSKAHSILVKNFMVAADELRYITMDTTLGEIKQMTDTLALVNAFPFVDSADSMILLGSIPKSQLLRQIDECIGSNARRAEVKRLRDVESDARLVAAIIEANENRICGSNWGTEAPKPKMSAPARIETQANGESSKARAISTPLATGETQINISDPVIMRTVNKLISTFNRKKKQIEEALADEYDMTEEERIKWEATRLEAKLDFQRLQIDNAPIQLVERTSLHKAHSLFSLLSLERAYVTRMGRIVGVVGLRDIRRALEDRSAFVTEDKLDDDTEQKKKKLNGYGGSSEGLIPVALQPIRARKVAAEIKAKMDSIEETEDEGTSKL